jgi:multidrug resistance efflux pump
MASVQRGDIDATISATGTSNAVVSVQVGSQVSGNIKALYADFNTKVTKGQLVALIDPEIFQARVNQAQANLDNARISVLNYGAQVQKAAGDVAAARTQVKQSEVTLRQASIDLEHTRILAPVDGGLRCPGDLLPRNVDPARGYCFRIPGRGRDRHSGGDRRAETRYPEGSFWWRRLRSR